MLDHRFFFSAIVGAWLRNHGNYHQQQFSYFLIYIPPGLAGCSLHHCHQGFKLKLLDLDEILSYCSLLFYFSEKKKSLVTKKGMAANFPLFQSLTVPQDLLEYPFYLFFLSLQQLRLFITTVASTFRILPNNYSYLKTYFKSIQKVNICRTVHTCITVMNIRKYYLG